MKKKTKIIVLVSFLCIMFGIVALYNKEIFIESAKVKIAQTLLSNELQIKDKTLNSVDISWGNIDVPNGTATYNVYQDNQLISNVTTSNYLFTNLNGGGTQYNFKIEYLDSNGNILLTKDINNITVASTITSFNQNATYSKDTYYIASDVIPTGVIINFEAGSILKINQGSKLQVNGELNINGTEEYRGIITSTKDNGNGYLVNWTDHFGGINVSSTGKIKFSNTDIKNVGYNYSWYISEPIKSTNGNVELNNTTITNNTTPSDFTGGILTLNGCNFSNGIYATNLSDINLKNSTFTNMLINYSNLTLANNVDIENNNITDGIEYTTNVLSNPVIKNNVISNSNYSVIRMNLLNSNKDVFSNISGNTNIATMKHGEIGINSSLPISGELNFPKRVYGIYSAEILKDLKVNVESGSMLKVNQGLTLKVNGELNLNGTDEERTIITSINDIGMGYLSNWSDHFGGINVSSTGKIKFSNTDIKNVGYHYYSWYISEPIKSTNGNVELNNTTITNNTTPSDFTGGILTLNGCDFSNGIYATNLNDINLKNSTFTNMLINYSNLTLANNVDIENNNITDGIEYTTNVLSNPVIKNNVISNSNYSVIRMNLLNSNKDVFLNISGNTNIATMKHGEIGINSSLPISGELNFPKRVYGIYSAEILKDLKVNVESGTMLKVNQGLTLKVNGELNLNGTDEERTIITSTNDIGMGYLSNWSDHFGGINVSSTGKINFSNTDIKNVGYHYYSWYISEPIKSTNGNVELNNTTITNNTTPSDFTGGVVKLNGCDFSNGIYATNLSDINLKNSTFTNMLINYSNLTLANNVDIENNNITNGIEYTPNSLSIPIIKNNTSSANYPLNLNFSKATPSVFQDVANNSCSNQMYNSIFMYGNLDNNLKLSKQNTYSSGSLNVLPGKLLEIEEGTKLKLEYGSIIYVKGNLVVNGTKENVVSITNKTESATNYAGSIYVANTGFAVINNMDMKYFGINSSNYPAIYNEGKLYLLNSSITNSQNGGAIYYGTTNTDQILKYNYLGGNVTRNTSYPDTLDATCNYWGASDGPRRFNTNTNQYEGNGSKVESNVLWNVYNPTFIKSDITLDTYINDVKRIETNHFGEAGVNGYTGNYSKTFDDLNIAIPNIDLKFTRTYNSKNDAINVLGRGWSFGFSSRIEINPLNSNILWAYLPNGSVNTFTKQVDGSFVSNDSRNVLTKENGIYVLTTKEQVKYMFNGYNYLNKIVDKYLNETNLTVDYTGKITQIVDYTGRTYNISYTNDKITSITDPLNRTVTYGYNDNGLLNEVVGLNSKSIYYEYDQNGYMTCIKEQNDLNQINTVESISYTLEENSIDEKVSSISYINGKQDNYTYNTVDKTTSITDQNNRMTISYFDASGYTTKVINQAGLETNISYILTDGVNKYGDIETKKDFTGNKVTYERDLKGNVLKQINVDNTFKTYEYNSKNSITKETDEVGNITEYFYATDGTTLVKKTMPNNSEINFEYAQTGIKGLVNKKTDEVGNQTTYEYDSYGNVTKTTDVTSGDYLTFSYNALGFLLSKTTAQGYTTTYEYDNVGNNTKIIENNIPTISTYNYKNNLVSKINANVKTISYEYDNNQNITKKTDEAGNQTTYEYDIYNNIIKETKPNSAVYIYTYDNLDRNISTLVQKENSNILLEEKTYSYLNGTTTTNTKTYTKDSEYVNSTKVVNYLDKVTSESVEDRVKTTTYTPNGLVESEQNEVGKRIYYTYNNIGKVATKYEEIDNNLYKYIGCSYDAAGNLVEEKTSQEKVSLNSLPITYITTNYTYDSNGNKILKTTSSGEEIKYTYDKDKNVVKEEVKISDSRYKITEYSYNYAKKITSKKEHIEKGSLSSNNIDDTELTVFETKYEYDNMNNLTKEISPDLTTFEYTYDNLNRQLSKKIKDSQNTKEITTSQTYLFDTKDTLTSKTDGNANVTNYEYDMFGNMVKEIAPNNQITTYEYDLMGNAIKEKLPLNSSDEDSYTKYLYDKYGNVVEKTKVYLVDVGQYKQITTYYEYDGLNKLLKETTNGISKSTTYNKASKEISKKDGNGNVTTYSYDANLNKTQEVNSNNTEIKYFYDERNNLVKTTIDNVVDEENTYDLANNKISQKDSLGKVLENTYDINCNLVKQKDTSTNYEIKNQYTNLKKVARTIDNYDKEIKYTYDILGNETSKQEQKQDGSQSITTSIEYDNVSNKTKEVDGKGNATIYTYDENNNLKTEKNPKNQTTTYEYDLNGNQTKEIDYLGNEKKYVYDKLDRVIQKIDEYNTVVEKLEYDDLGRQTKSIDSNNKNIEFTYDGNGNVIAKKDQEGNIEYFEYDELKNKTKYIDKNGNVTTYMYTNKNKIKKVTNALNEITDYTYDNAGNLLTQKDGKNNITQYQYDLNGNEIKKIDALGNIEEKTYSPNGLMATYISNNGDTFVYDYDIHGRLIKETLGQEETTYEYDGNDNKTKIGSITKTYDGLDRILTSTENSQTITYAYDDQNKKKTTTDQKGNIKTEEYDKVNRLVKVTTGTDITEYVYNQDGSVQKQTNPNTESNYEYYTDNKVKRLTTKDKSGNIIEENYYEYDSNNNVLKDNAKTYTYDALNRIHTAIDNAKTTTYTYDAAGNILTKATLDGVNLKTVSYVYNEKNQLLSTSTIDNTTNTQTEYTYDDNGNQITETTGTDVTTNTYSARNELTQVEKGQDISTYGYNSEGKRIQKTVNNITTKFVYDKDDIILELDNQNAQIANNTYGLALIKRNATTKGYYIYNAHGDVLKILDENNNILNTYEYDEFGSIKNETGTFNNPYRYAGYYYDKETKTYYLQARYYNPDIQRFISEDTYRGELEDPLSLNSYTYVVNNPMIYIDPTGHTPTFVTAAIGALIGGIINLGINGFSDYIDDGHFNRNGKSYLGAFAEGAIVGGAFGLLGPGASLITQTSVAFGAGAVGNSTNQLISTGNVNIKNAVISRSNNFYRNSNIWSR